jgi:hypothetical protein
MLKMVVVGPMPRAMVKAAMTVKPGDRLNTRIA